MVALGILVVLAVVVAGFGATRLHGRAPVGPGPAPPVPDDRLDHWVEAGLVSREQAAAIRTFEHEHARGREPAAGSAAARPRPTGRVAPGVEALAYVGGILLAVGAGMLVARFWHDLGVGGRLGVLAAATVLAIVVGAAVGESDGVTWRLRGFLWGLGAVGAAAVAGIFVVEVLGVTGTPVACTVGATTTIVSAALWQLRDRPLQHALVLVGLAVALGSAIAWIGEGRTTGLAIGLALWVLGGVWAWLAWRDLVPPDALGFLLGAALTLVGAGIVNAQVSWLAPLLGLATAGAWVAVGVVRTERLALVPGILGMFVFLPWTLLRFFGDSLGAPVVAMVSGAVLLGVVLVLVRHGGGGSGRHRPTRWRTTAYGAGP